MTNHQETVHLYKKQKEWEFKAQRAAATAKSR